MMQFTDLAGLTTWVDRERMSNAKFAELKRRAEAVAAEERRSTPEQWTWLHCGSLDKQS